MSAGLFERNLYPCECCCVFRKRITPPGGIIARTNSVIVYHNLSCAIEGIFVIAPILHVKYIEELSISEKQQLFDTAYIVKQFLEARQDNKEAYIVRIIEDGAMHARIWITPSMKGLLDEPIDHAWLENSESLQTRVKEDFVPPNILRLTQKLKKYIKKLRK